MHGMAHLIPREPLSVSAPHQQIKGISKSNGYLWVEGEISQLNHHRSGHVYLSLKDSDARIDAVVRRSTVNRLRYRPEPGEKVQVRGRWRCVAARRVQTRHREYPAGGQGASKPL